MKSSVKIGGDTVMWRHDTLERYVLMTRIFLMLCFVVQFAMVGCAHPPLAKVTIHAVNQDGKPVTDYQIHASFLGGKEGLKKWPDENGYVTFKSPVFGWAVFSEVSKFDMRHPGVEKYYPTMIRKKYDNPSKNSKDGKWQPWNPTIEMVLKERINPIPMYAPGISLLRPRLIPVRNQWIGFDMEKMHGFLPTARGYMQILRYVTNGTENSMKNTMVLY